MESEKKLIEQIIDEMGFTKRGLRDKRPLWLCDINRLDIESGLRKAIRRSKNKTNLQ